jgi:copper oxidase (laccase) domain-containing protein
MPYQFHEAADPHKLASTRYGFFTNENGHSEGSYVVVGKPTRNVNPYSPAQEGEAHDPAANVVENIESCFEELFAGRSGERHKLFMTTAYAKPAPIIKVCPSLEELIALKEEARVYVRSDERPVHPSMADELLKNDISFIKADSIVVKGIEGHQIAVGGASGDAHPLVIYDDVAKVACYMSGAHACLSKGVLEESLKAMHSLGADPANIRLVIGPGLGAKSYEFGDDAGKYLGVSPDCVTLVKDRTGVSKALLDIQKIIAFKATGLMDPKNILDMEVNTMGFDLYDQVGDDPANLERKESVHPGVLQGNGNLFFSARRQVMQKEGALEARNAGLHNTVGRHGAGIVMG